MTRTRCAMAVALLGVLAGSAPAQFVIGLPTIGQGGIAFSVKGNHIKVGGFVPLGPPYPAVMPVRPTPFGFQQIGPAYLPYGYYGYPPVAPGFPFPGYGAIDQRITVQVVNPPTVVVRRNGARQEPDLSGIDLDVESAEKIWGKRPEVAAAPPKKNGEAVKAPLPPKEKKQQVVAAPPKPAPEPPPPPKAEPVLEGDRLIARGITAFKHGEYGLAHFRFRQAADAEPPGKRAQFLQAQASIAIGKHREAVELIQKGLRHDRDWPLAAFRPKVELYDNNLEAWNEHLTALEESRKLRPDNGDYPFLLGYLEWFGGDRALAREYFLAARVLAADVRWCDAFLKAAK